MGRIPHSHKMKLWESMELKHRSDSKSGLLLTYSKIEELETRGEYSLSACIEAKPLTALIISLDLSLSCAL